MQRAVLTKLFLKSRRVGAATTVALALALAGGFGAADAQTTTDNLKSFHTHWGAFVSGSGATRRCFAATKPQSSEIPPGVSSRGDPFLLVSTFPNDGAVNEVSAVIGFEADNDKGVTLTIDGRSYPMFGNGAHAWLTREEDNAPVVTALRAGAKASVTATSKRGNTITDSYSLIGFTAAINSVAELCK